MNNKGKRVKEPRDSPTRLQFRVWLMGWVLRGVIGGVLKVEELCKRKPATIFSAFSK
ncbi:hypothetical protein OIU84_013189 [Salix udensis]|uniref:Uncharacterized protein n=1 Tax=Salix udensis TaxID=889485 RepID=A0AAD6JJE6_9ROSI|nr:hypothetical protein OIU84_013189 [Salix udensis]